MSEDRPLFKIVFNWSLLLAWVAFIYLTLGIVPDWRDTLVEQYGEQIFTTITYFCGGAGLVILLGILLFVKREKRPMPYLSMVLVLLSLYYVLKYRVTLPVEQIHFIEYGVVGFLSYRTLRLHLSGWGLITASILLTFTFGMVDETIQGLLANRVGEQRDMYWNGLAGIMALAIVAFSLRPHGLFQRSGVRELRVHLVMIAFCLLVQGYFNSAVSQFGYFYHDRELNLSFKSRLPMGKLLDYRENLDDFKTRIAPHIGKVRMVILLDRVHDLIHEEALVHCFRREYHFRRGNIRTVYSEDLLIDKYYKAFVEGTHLDWPRSRSLEMRPVVGKRFEILYHSIVANHLITSFRCWQMWLVIGILELFILVAFILTGKRKPSRDFPAVSI